MDAVRKRLRFSVFLPPSDPLARLFHRSMQGVMRAMPVVQVHNKKEAQ